MKKFLTKYCNNLLLTVMSIYLIFYCIAQVVVYTQRERQTEAIIEQTKQFRENKYKLNELNLMMDSILIEEKRRNYMIDSISKARNKKIN